MLGVIRNKRILHLNNKFYSMNHNRYTSNIKIGTSTVIEKGVIFNNPYPNSPINIDIGENNHIKSGTIIYSNVTIGDNNIIDNNSVLGYFNEIEKSGRFPQGVVIGDFNDIRANTYIESGHNRPTRIGDLNVFMPFVSLLSSSVVHNKNIICSNVHIDTSSIVQSQTYLGNKTILKPYSIVGDYASTDYLSVVDGGVFPYTKYNNESRLLSLVEYRNISTQYDKIKKELSEILRNSDMSFPDSEKHIQLYAKLNYGLDNITRSFLTFTSLVHLKNNEQNNHDVKLY